ncbi:site-specific integrase [Pseudomonas sp. JDS28PS106]|uniref:site-specific integrase n=1 Tax=Pseudomonas sp. JDS28PS106 TaxID=2497235 RepID=UPI002FD04F38
MINTSLDQVKFISENQPRSSTIASIELMYGELRHERGATPQVFWEETNKSILVKYAPLEWLNSIRGVGLTQEQVQAAFNLSVLGTSNENLERKLFESATGITNATIRTIRGFKTPLRGLMLCLWRHEYLLLPISFQQGSVSLIVPGLNAHLENFFSEVAMRGNNTNLKTCLKYTLFTLNWHTIEQVDFTEAWAAVSEISKGRKTAPPENYKYNPFRYFRLTSWLEQFHWQHPSVLSADQVKLIQAYTQTIGPSQYGNYKFDTPEQFAEYYAKSFNEKKSIQVGAYIARERKKEKTIRLEGNSSSEIYFANITVKNRAGFQWLQKEGYIGIPVEETINLSADWFPFLDSYNEFLLGRKIKKHHRKTLLSPVYKLCDYLFAYLPKWREENPHSSVPIPVRVDDFSAVFFWKRMLPASDPRFQSLGPLPLPLLEAIKLQRDSPASKSFVSAIQSFFQYCLDNHARSRDAGLYALDEDFANPIDLKDSQGSGPRKSGTDKQILPPFSVGVVRHYVSALDSIGRSLRDFCLNQKISNKKIREISRSEWIDLTDLGLEYTLITRSPSETEKTVEVPIKQVPNCYTWIWDNYHITPGSKEQIYTGAPWLSILRMISVGLFAGQRLQNAQWLGLDNYRCQHKDGTSYYTALFLMVDKIYSHRTCRLQRSIMEWLDDEAEFQTRICSQAPEACYFEDDEHSGYPETRWLFRSPYGKTDSAFSDAAYSSYWILILRGVQEVWNSIAPEDTQYNFVTKVEQTLAYPRRGTPEYTTPHTPHSLRNTYITWMLERGLAEPSEVMKQVGHTNLLQTYHYASGPRPGTDYSMEIADMRIEAFDHELLSNLAGAKPVKASAPESALRSSLLTDKKQAMEAQHMISLTDGLIETKETGYDLIKVALIEDLGFFDTCICVFNGRCTSAVLLITKGPRRCGMCPFAVYALDHLEGINARMRQLQRHIKSIETLISQLEAAGETEIMIRSYREDKGLSTVEYSGYEQVTNLMNAALADAKHSTKRYLIRDPEILTKHPVAVMTDDPIQKIVSDLLDSSQYPSFSNENYIASLRRAARAMNLKGFDSTVEYEVASPKAYLGQIATQLRLLGWTLKDLSRNFLLHYPDALEGIGHG